MQTINYGIHRDYLQSWGLTEALREIFQNFIDYGEYEIKAEDQVTVLEEKKLTFVSISNDYIPTDLSFLAIGKSIKHQEQSIGKHGEGLKMAMLIFLREDLDISIATPIGVIKPAWERQKHIGETLALDIFEPLEDYPKFTIEFIIPTELYETYIKDIIQPIDKLFTYPMYGSIVDRPKGNLYSGGLFVCHLSNLSKAYDILPKELSLDRDRKVPKSFDVSYKTSKINEAQAKWDFTDQNYSDTQYISWVPKEQLSKVKAREVQGKVEFFTPAFNKEEGKEVLTQITNESIKETLIKHSFFSKAVKGIKNYIASKLGVKDLLISFRSKYCYNDDARRDFDIILERLGIELNIDS